MLEKIKSKLVGNRTISNSIWIIGGKVFQMGLTLIIGMITARYLGPSNYGVIGYTASYVSFFSVVCQLGYTSTIVKELIEHKDQQGTTLGTTIFFRVCTSLLSSIVLTALVYVMDDGDPIIVKVAFLQSLSLVFHSFEMIHYWYQSRLESSVSVKIQTLAYTVMAIYKIAILALGMSVEWFAFSTTLEAAVVAGSLVYAYRKSKGQKMDISPRLGREMLKVSYHFILSGLMSTIYSEMDKIMLGQMLNETAVGYYTAAMKISTMWSFVLMAFIDSMRPGIISAKTVSEEQYLRKLKRLYAIIIWIGIVAALCISIGGKWIIYLMYGQDYMPAVSTLKISAWYTMFSILGGARGIWVVCENKGRYVKYYLGIGAVINLILNWTLIPIYGSGGAAAATLITQIFTAVFAPMIFKETRVYGKHVLDSFLLRGIR